MKLYQTIDGTLIGFYKEKGGAVQAVLYRDIYEQQMVNKIRQEVTRTPGYFKTETITVPGYWKTERVYVQGHYEIQPYWFEEYSITRYREVPGHYEILQHWFEEYSITRYRTVPGYWEPYEVTRPADPVTGRIEVTYTQYRWIEEHVEEYEEVIPAGFKDTRVWVDTKTEPYEEIMPAGFKDTRVWVDGKFEDEEVWVKETTKIEQVWVDEVIERKDVPYQELEEVWVGREPVYEYIDPMQVQGYEVLELIEAPAGRPDIEDSITIRNTETGEVLTTTATYIGLAQQIDENEYVVP